MANPMPWRSALIIAMIAVSSCPYSEEISVRSPTAPSRFVGLECWISRAATGEQLLVGGLVLHSLELLKFLAPLELSSGLSC